MINDKRSWKGKEKLMKDCNETWRLTLRYRASRQFKVQTEFKYAVFIIQAVMVINLQLNSTLVSQTCRNVLEKNA